MIADFKEERKRHGFTAKRMELLAELHSLDSQGIIVRDSDIFCLIDDLLLLRTTDVDFEQYVAVINASEDKHKAKILEFVTKVLTVFREFE